MSDFWVVAIGIVVTIAMTIILVKIPFIFFAPRIKAYLGDQFEMGNYDWQAKGKLGERIWFANYHPEEDELKISVCHQCDVSGSIGTRFLARDPDDRYVIKLTKPPRDPEFVEKCIHFMEAEGLSKAILERCSGNDWGNFEVSMKKVSRNFGGGKRPLGLQRILKKMDLLLVNHCE